VTGTPFFDINYESKHHTVTTELEHCVFWYMDSNVMEEHVASIFREGVNMEVICASDIWIVIHKSTKCHSPNEHNMNLQHHKHLISYS